MIKLRTTRAGYKKETWEQQRRHGRYNPATVAQVGRWSMVIGAGESDTVRAFKEPGSDVVVILTYNWGLEYAGLELFDAGELVGEVFLQSPDDLGELIPNFFDLADINKAKHLAEYIY